MLLLTQTTHLIEIFISSASPSNSRVANVLKFIRTKSHDEKYKMVVKTKTSAIYKLLLSVKHD